uniref:Uncharacterized protein n=1 Tax=Chromera velia CCMP2878 TaxID=1169474 RepID=A0A0G4G3F2_9ALVE|eukprot:Cvel_20042.t1-p1 / transcript=Cvel_20042.t1 / gene=Cvel_20042 / organism=Chromera_velia_CCMP2878 / gene_product=hypothetical protein / transcript_product=hypothetical protein / location=Cvel_scaffold1771:16416-16790(+) / protein_length=125 / sequence_SO=supercontig / SO=protein_coding / is_pseudo=false
MLDANVRSLILSLPPSPQRFTLSQHGLSVSPGPEVWKALGGMTGVSEGGGKMRLRDLKIKGTLDMGGAKEGILDGAGAEALFRSLWGGVETLSIPYMGGTTVLQPLCSWMRRRRERERVDSEIHR